MFKVNKNIVINPQNSYKKKTNLNEHDEKQYKLLNYYLNILENSTLNKDQLNYIKADALGDDDLKKYFKFARVITISNLKDIKSIDGIFKHDRECIFLLYESSPNYGHWVLLSKYDNIIEYNDSYGHKIDHPLSWNSKEENIKLGNDYYLSKILSKAQTKYDIIYNDKNLQNEENLKVADCGRFAVLRAITILKNYQGLLDYNRMMTELKKITGFSYDDIVSSIITV